MARSNQPDSAVCKPRMLLCAVVLGLLAPVAGAHSIPTPTPVPPFRIEGKSLLDANRLQFVMLGVEMSGLDAAVPTDEDRQLVAAMTPLTFRVIRQRWNLNTVRLLISPWVWRRDGQDYLQKVADIVQLANAEGLLTVLVPSDSVRAGAPFDTGLPSPEIADFWGVWAAFFKDNPRVIFDLYSRPLPQSIPGFNPGLHRDADWDFWLNGGTATNGRTVVGMQQLVDRIRAAGATQQFITAPAFHDALEFKGFGASFYLKGSNIIYEAHPYFDHSLTDAQRDLNFGFLGSNFPLYAGEWGTPFQEDTPSCRSVPADPAKASDAVSQLLAYMAVRNISWTASSFEPNQLISGFDSYTATTLDRPWTCGQVTNPEPGIGGLILLFLTGDPAGFGSIAPDQIASAAGGPAGPVAPGEVVTFYGQLIGPEKDLPGQFDSNGVLSTLIGETEILFDGIPAPIFSAGYFQVTVQVPFELGGRATTIAQSSYRGVASNRIALQVVDSAPALFTVGGPTDILAINEGGSGNTAGAPASIGSIVVLYATGAGQTSPQGVTGRPAAAPYAKPNSAVSVSIGGFDAEILYAAEAPGLVGITQINARVPTALTPGAGTRTVPVNLSVGTRRSQSGVRIWVR